MVSPGEGAGKQKRQENLQKSVLENPEKYALQAAAPNSVRAGGGECKRVGRHMKIPRGLDKFKARRSSEHFISSTVVCKSSAFMYQMAPTPG